MQMSTERLVCVLCVCRPVMKVQQCTRGPRDCAQTSGPQCGPGVCGGGQVLGTLPILRLWGVSRIWALEPVPPRGAFRSMFSRGLPASMTVTVDDQSWGWGGIWIWIWIWIWSPILRLTGRPVGAQWHPQRLCVSAGHATRNALPGPTTDPGRGGGGGSQGMHMAHTGHACKVV